VTSVYLMICMHSLISVYLMIHVCTYVTKYPTIHIFSVISVYPMIHMYPKKYRIIVMVQDKCVWINVINLSGRKIS